MPSLPSLGPAREDAENRIKAASAAIAAQFGLADPLADFGMRGSNIGGDGRIDRASEILIQREMTARLLELLQQVLTSVFASE